MKKIIRKAAVYTSKTISSKSHMLISYADDVDIIGRTIREVTVVFSKIGRESKIVVLVVNKDNTKIMVSEPESPSD